MSDPPNPTAVDRAARLLLYEHVSELAWRVENIATTIQAQMAGGDDAGALHSLGRLYLTVTCLKDGEKMLKAIQKQDLTLARAHSTKEQPAHPRREAG